MEAHIRNPVYSGSASGEVGVRNFSIDEELAAVAAKALHISLDVGNAGRIL
jgi:hypothetical protein